MSALAHVEYDAPMTDEAEAILRMEKLGVRFGGAAAAAVDGVSLSVHPAQTLAVVGESGCGKTVTALSVLRLLDGHGCRVTGAIQWRGRNLLQMTERQMRSVRGGEIAMIFQEPMTSLNPVYSIGDQIMEAALLHRDVHAREAAELSEQAMADVGIDNPARRMRQYPHEFSGGMRQRAMIAMALVCRPQLLLADEPTTALDVTTQARILDLLRELKTTHGMAIMLITHDFGVVARHAEVVAVMYGGNVVEYAAARDLFRQPWHPYTKALLCARPVLHGQRRRLESVHATLRDASVSGSGVAGNRDVTPWWPEHDRPDNVRVSNGGSDSVLHEVQPGRWVRCWRTAALRDAVERIPDLARRRNVTIEKVEEQHGVG